MLLYCGLINSSCMCYVDVSAAQQGWSVALAPICVCDDLYPGLGCLPPPPCWGRCGRDGSPLPPWGIGAECRRGFEVGDIKSGAKRLEKVSRVPPNLFRGTTQNWGHHKIGGSTHNIEREQWKHWNCKNSMNVKQREYATSAGHCKNMYTHRNEKKDIKHSGKSIHT